MFVSFYVATLILFTWLRFGFGQISWLMAACVATALTIAILERGRWNLGLFVSPRFAIPEFLFGGVWGAMLVGACALLVVLTSEVRHQRGAGFPWIEVAFVYLPAAVHEELLFRGYPFQKLYRWNRNAALFITALFFTVLHARNPFVTPLALANIFLGGVLLGLAYARYERLWFPIGLHLAWNLMSGPVLGHEVSGYESAITLFVESEQGPAWLTGGDFGIEGSVWMTVTELAGIVLLGRALAVARVKEHSE